MDRKFPTRVTFPVSIKCWIVATTSSSVSASSAIAETRSSRVSVSGWLGSAICSAVS